MKKFAPFGMAACFVLVSVLFFQVAAAHAAWHFIDSMDQPRTQAASAVIDGKIYVFGGTGDNMGINSLNVYNPANNQWTGGLATNTQGGFYEITGAAHDGKLYVFGGRLNSDTLVSFADAYDVATDTWKYIPNSPDNIAPRPNITASATAVGYTTSQGYRIFLFGGYTQLDIGPQTIPWVDAYDPASNTWQQMTDMPVAVAGAVYGVAQGKIYLVGGINVDGYQTEVMAYDPEKDEWSGYQETSLGFVYDVGSFTTSSAAPVVNGQIYIAGGFLIFSVEPAPAVQVYDPVFKLGWGRQPLNRPLASQMLVGMGNTLYTGGGFISTGEVTQLAWNGVMDDGQGIDPDQQKDVPADTDLNEDQIADLTQPDVIKDIYTVHGSMVVGVDKTIDPKIQDISLVHSVPYDAFDGRLRNYNFSLLALRLTTHAAGDSVTLCVRFSKNTPLNARWDNWNREDGFSNFSGQTEYVGDGRQTLYLHLTDGGAGDADKQADGVIHHMGGLSQPIPPQPEVNVLDLIPEGTGCFLDSMGQGRSKR